MMSASPIEPEWYVATSSVKHTSQVVVILPPESETPPRVHNLVASYVPMMTANWAADAVFLRGDSSDAIGPFVFAKATGCVELLKGHPASVAFAFYHLAAGGVFQVFVEVDAPKIRALAHSPYLAERAHWPGDLDKRNIITGLISRDQLEVCFVAPGPNGPCTGYFGLRVALPEAARRVLWQEWERLLVHHSSVQVSSFESALDQYNRENPLEESPILRN